MTRTTVVVLAVVCSALVAIGFGTVRLVGQARADLLEQLDRSQLRQVNELARLLREDIEHVGADLRFVGGLVQGAPSAADRRDEIAALMTSVREYHLAAIYDESGAVLLSVADPGLERELSAARFAPEMARTALDALRLSPGQVVSAHPFDVGGESFRVFAMSLPDRRPGRPAAVAVVVDTQTLFAKLRLITADNQSRVMLLGAGGRPTSATDPSLAAAARALDRGAMPGYAGLIAAMRGQRRGLRHLDAREAARLGLGEATAVAAFAPVDAGDDGRWSVATMSSTATFEAHERSLVLCVGGAGLAVALLLIGFGGYLVVTQRRAAALRERLRASEALAAAHARTQKILDHIPTGVMTFSADGRLRAVNHALEGRVPAEALGAPLSRAFPDAPEPLVRMVRALVSSARGSEQVQSLYGEAAALFGQEGRYNLHAVPIELRGADPRILFVVEDVSHVHALESQLLRAEKLATIGELAAGMAHEVGTPLGVVRGRAEYVLRKLGPDHAQREGIADIVEQIDQVTRSIRQLLDFARIAPAAVQPVDVRDTLRDIAELLRFEAERRKIELAVEVEARLEPAAADPDQLQQVLVNLTKNALDACGAGGHVTLRARAEPDEPRGRRLRLEVADDGCGIPAANLHRIFDPFFTTKKRGQGTGLGLAVTAQVVRNHGAEIRVDSEERRGSRVSLFWPTAEAEERRSHG